MLNITVGRRLDLEGARSAFQFREDYALVATGFRGPSSVGGPWNTLFWRWLTRNDVTTSGGGSGVLYTLNQVNIEKDDPDRYNWYPRDKTRFAGEFVVYAEEDVRRILVVADERTIEHVATNLVSEALNEAATRAFLSSTA